MVSARTSFPLGLANFQAIFTDNPGGETQTGAVLSEGFLRNLSRRVIIGSGSLVLAETQAAT